VQLCAQGQKLRLLRTKPARQLICPLALRSAASFGFGKGGSQLRRSPLHLVHVADSDDRHQPVAPLHELIERRTFPPVALTARRDDVKRGGDVSQLRSAERALASQYLG